MPWEKKKKRKGVGGRKEKEIKGKKGKLNKGGKEIKIKKERK